MTPRKQTFHFGWTGLKGRELFWQRFFGILPGLTSWMSLAAVVALTLWQPVLASVLVIAFLLYWVFRLAYLTLFLVFSYFRLSVEKKTSWIGRIRGLADRGTHYIQLLSQTKVKDFREKLSNDFHRNDINRLLREGIEVPRFGDIYQLVIIPVIKENKEVVEGNLQRMTKSTFPLEQILVVIALESRASEHVRSAMNELAEHYRDHFFDFLVVEHPDGLPGEARVKGANATYAAKAAAQFFEEKAIPFDDVIVSCFDADTQVSTEYFSCLTYYFMIRPDRLRLSFQPIPVYYNNIWKVPGVARVLETGSSFFQLIEATNPEKLVTFSSHSMSFKALVEIGYWPVDMISDDSAIFWKAYLHYEGVYRVLPIYTTLSMDVLDSGVWWKTILSLYKQKRRWAWGVENFPIVMRGFMHHSKISWWDKLRHGFKLFESHVTWATLPFLVTMVGWLPGILANQEFANTVLFFNSRRLIETLFSLSTLALLATIVISQGLLPRKTEKSSTNIWRRLLHAVEWLLVPFVLIFLSAAPALDAQTRLMLNKPMEFWVSEKRRK